AREAQQRAAAAGEKVVTLPGRDRNADVQQQQETFDAEEAEAKVTDYAGSDDSLREGLREIFRRDNTFDPDEFMSGAKQAYEMIVTAFAEGNRRMLRDLLSDDVYEGFSAAIDDRDQQHLQIDQSFVGINAAKIIEADVKNGDEANVTVKFQSQLISATRDKGGEVISGDPQRVQDVTDIWTFARDLSTQDPNWKLIGTQSTT
ncbi:MAG: Tim44/TimA family putative adaptor protein, partial [Pseudomonadota bacterium]